MNGKIQSFRDAKLRKKRKRFKNMMKQRGQQLARSPTIRFAVAVIRWIAKLFNKPVDTPPPAVSEAKAA